MSCPVCGEKLQVDDDYMGYILLQEVMICPNKHYTYEYLTGSYEWNIGETEIHAHYTFTPAEMAEVDKRVNAAIAEEKEKWQGGKSA